MAPSTALVAGSGLKLPPSLRMVKLRSSRGDWTRLDVLPFGVVYACVLLLAFYFGLAGQWWGEPLSQYCCTELRSWFCSSMPLSRSANCISSRADLHNTAVGLWGRTQGSAWLALTTLDQTGMLSGTSTKPKPHKDVWPK